MARSEGLRKGSASAANKIVRLQCHPVTLDWIACAGASLSFFYPTPIPTRAPTVLPAGVHPRERAVSHHTRRLAWVFLSRSQPHPLIWGLPDRPLARVLALASYCLPRNICARIEAAPKLQDHTVVAPRNEKEKMQEVQPMMIRKHCQLEILTPQLDANEIWVLI